MNIKNKISGIFLLTTVIVIGGGFVYYSMLSDIRQVSGAVSTLYLQKAESPTVRLDNINSKNRSEASHKQQRSFSVPRMATTPLYKEAGVEATVSISNKIQSGSSTSYTYSKKSRDTKSSYQHGGFGSISILTYGSNKGRDVDNEQSVQNFGAVAITEPGAKSPFAVPRNPLAPPSNGEGIIMVDPMTDPLVTNRIPVGEGGWILLLLALGYVVWKTSPSNSPEGGESESEMKNIR